MEYGENSSRKSVFNFIDKILNYKLTGKLSTGAECFAFYHATLYNTTRKHDFYNLRSWICTEQLFFAFIETIKYATSI